MLWEKKTHLFWVTFINARLELSQLCSDSLFIPCCPFLLPLSLIACPLESSFFICLPDVLRLLFLDSHIHWLFSSPWSPDLSHPLRHLFPVFPASQPHTLPVSVCASYSYILVLAHLGSLRQSFCTWRHVYLHLFFTDSHLATSACLLVSMWLHPVVHSFLPECLPVQMLFF